MTRERLDGWCEKLLAALVLAILVFGPLALGGVRARDFIILEWLTGSAAMVWIARLWINPGQPVLWTPVSWAVLAFVALAGARWATADIEYVAREEVLKVLMYALLFLIISTNLTKQKYEKAIVTTLLVMAVALSLYAAFQYLAQSPKVWNYVRPFMYGRRGSGTFFNPNHLAGFLELIVPFGVAFCLVGRLKPWARIAAGYAAVMGLVGIGVSLSRGGWLATAASFLALFGMLLLHRVHRAVSIAVLSLMLLAGCVFVLQSRDNQQRFSEVFKEGRVDNIRFQVWKPAIDIWHEYFWFGAGPAHFDIQFRKHRPPTVQMRPDRAHNDYLNTLADWGVVGTAFVALPWILLAVLLWKSWGNIARSANTLGDVRSNRLALAIGGVASLVAILAHSVTDFNMHIPSNAILVVTIFALLTGMSRHESEACLKWPATGARLALTVFLIASCGLLAWAGARRWHEEKLIAKANRLIELPKLRIKQLEAAFDFEPANPTTAYNLGETYRLMSWRGNSDYAQFAEQAIPWFDRAMKLQPYDPYAPVGKGMCLDWLSRFDEAEPWFHKAQELDPNNFFVMGHLGWHYVQKEDYHTAKPYLERSLQIRSWDNDVARDYLDLVNRRLAEEAENKKQAR